MAACAQIINADFDDLKRGRTTTATGAAGMGEGGGAGMGGDAGRPVTCPDTSSMGGASGNGGMGGMGGSGGMTGGASGMAGSRDSGPDAVADSSDARPDVEPDRSVTDGPKEGSMDAPPDVVVSDGEGGILAGATVNEINGQGALEDYVEIYNNASVPDNCEPTFGHAGHRHVRPSRHGERPYVRPWAPCWPPTKHLLIVANQAPPRMKGGPHMPCDVPGFDAPPYSVTACYWVDWGVSKSGERIYLLNPGGDVREYVDFPIPGAMQPPSGKSYGRFPDGVGPFQSLGTAWTPQAENHL